MTIRRSLAILGMVYALYFIVFFSYLIPGVYLGPYPLGIVQILLILTAGGSLIKYLQTFFKERSLAGILVLAGYALTIVGLLWLTFVWAFATFMF